MTCVAELDKFDMTVLSLSDMMPAVGVTDP
jgi:hypothetical protein